MTETQQLSMWDNDGPAGETTGGENPQQVKTKKPEAEDAHVLVTQELMKQLRANARRGSEVPPVLKIFSPAGSATWLILSIEKDEDTMFGLCDLGMGFPELGYVSLQELRETDVPIRLRINGENEVKLSLPLERDLYFQPTHALEVYTEASRKHDCITEQHEQLDEASQRCDVRKRTRRR